VNTTPDVYVDRIRASLARQNRPLLPLVRQHRPGLLSDEPSPGPRPGWITDTLRSAEAGHPDRPRRLRGDQ